MAQHGSCRPLAVEIRAVRGNQIADFEVVADTDQERMMRGNGAVTDTNDIRVVASDIDAFPRQIKRAT